jgi:hypothetical protein
LINLFYILGFILEADLLEYKNQQNIIDMLSIISDLLIVSFINKKIPFSFFEENREDFLAIKDILAKKINLTIENEFKTKTFIELLNSKMMKYYKNTSNKDIIIESIKI